MENSYRVKLTWPKNGTDIIHGMDKAIVERRDCTTWLLVQGMCSLALILNFLEKKILVDMSISLSIYLVKVTTVNIHMTAYLLGRVAKSFEKFCKVFYVYCLCHVRGLGQCSVSVDRNMFLAGQIIL